MHNDGRWPGHPRLLPEESFSSWFSRTAAANGLRPTDLFRIVQPDGLHVPPDLDRYADMPLLDVLVERTGHDRDSLAQSTFRCWAGTVFAQDDGLTKLAWLPPAGRQGGNRCFGQQLCPSCLQGDHQPYLRLPWRLSFLTVCPVHGRLLLDRCPSCNEPFSILRNKHSRGMRCWSCGADPRRFTSDEPMIQVIPTQEAILEMVQQGWQAMGVYGPVYSFAVLQILSLLTRLLAAGRYAHPLRVWIAEKEPALAVSPEVVPCVREGRMFNSKTRSVLVCMAYWLMEEWPSRFVAAAQSVGLTVRDIFKHDEGLYPFAFADAVDQNLEASLKRNSSEEVATVKALLMRQGKSSTRRNLAELIGSHRRVLSDFAEPVVAGHPWGQGRYWKLDGVSPEVKEAARLAAHRAGEGVGPWLDTALRKMLGLAARKTPYDGQNIDSFPRDGVAG